MSSTDSTPKPKRRRWLKWLGVGGLIAVAVLLAMPVWLPWVVVPVLEKQGVAIGGYRREGTSRLALLQVGYTNFQLEAHADSIVIQLPHRWLMDRFLARTNRDGLVQLSLDHWRVHPLPKSVSKNSPSTNSLQRVLDQTESILASMRPWIRLATAQNGELVIGDRRIAAKSVTLRPGSLRLQAEDAAGSFTANLRIDFTETNSFRFLSSIPEYDASSELILSRTNDTWSVEGELFWQTNRARILAGIGKTGWLPESMSATGTNWIVPANAIGLDGYRALTGGFDLSWTNDRYRFVVEGDATPTENNPLVPDRINVDVAGLGNLGALAIERLNVSTPALQARLSDPLAIDFTGRMLVPAATLQVSADFTEKSDLPFTGQLDGTVTARPDLTKLVNASFEVHVNRLVSGPLNVDRVNLDGALRWPELVVSNANFAFPNGGTFRLTGGLDLLNLVSTNVNWAFEGALPTNLVPAGLTIESIKAQGAASGRWPDLLQNTELVVSNTEWKGARADKVNATLTGLATGTNDWQFALKHNGLSIFGGGKMDLAGLNRSIFTASLTNFQATLATNSTLTLAQPVDMEADWKTNAANRFSIQVSPLKLTGKDRQLELAADVQWPASGSVTLAATNIATADFAGLLARQLPTVDVRELVLTAAWDHGPLIFSTLADLTWNQTETGLVDGHIRARGNAGGIAFEPVIVSINSNEVFSLAGHLPLYISPGNEAPVQWLDEGEFDARLKSLEGDPVWNRLARKVGLELVGPQINLTASGHLRDFQAQLDFIARSIRPLDFTNLPSDVAVVSNLQLHAEASRQLITLSKGSFTVAGQPGRISAELPFEAKTWAEWLTEVKRIDWKKAKGELVVPGIDMAAVAPLLNDSLSPVGRAAIRLQLEPGGNLQGFVAVTNLETRPIERVGSIRDISGRLDFDAGQAEIGTFRATLNGQPLRFGGKAAWNADGLTSASLFLNATNLSLVRSTDLFLRGDLDLRLTADGKSPPTISGDLMLNNSLLFQDLGRLVSIDLKQPERRPPFFSVPNPPLDDWRFDVRVRGQKFLRVLSPVFKGEVSTGLQLTGTLKEPVALGEVSIDRGQMLFPFGALEVTRGVVQLTQANPHRPRVDFRGQGMNFGYNVTVEVTGYADAPNITFSSVPPLTTREIMLMLTAGEIPGGAYSYTTVDKASKLGYFLGKELINQLFGLNTGEDKLIFRTGEYVTDDGQLTYRIEYKLIDRLSIFGEYTRFRDYNGGLKFNVYSR